MKKIFAANWKMNKTPAQSKEFTQKLLNQLSDNFFDNKEIYIFPQNFSLTAVADAFQSSAVTYNSLQWGPQHIHSELSGAYTGENSLLLAKSTGAQLCLIGHSERRQLFSETDEAISMKVQICQKHNVLPVVCIGETLQERQSGKTFDILFKQLSAGLSLCDKDQKLVIAYEPVWAIGTGQVATVQQVVEVHARLHLFLNEKGYKNVSLLYGGSVKAENAKDLISIPHVDGFLIGGASLEVDSFLKICNSI